MWQQDTDPLIVKAEESIFVTHLEKLRLKTPFVLNSSLIEMAVRWLRNFARFGSCQTYNKHLFQLHLL